MHLVPQSDTMLKIVWSGNTWAYRDTLDEQGVKGYFHSEEGDKENNKDGEAKRVYYRVMELDCSTEGAYEKLRDDILTNVFHNVAMHTKIEHSSEVEAGSYVSDVIEALKGKPNLHFVVE